MAGTGYIYDVPLSTDGTPEHSVDELLMDDGTPFPFSDYAAEYAVSGEYGGTIFQLNQTSGVAVDADNNAITFTLPSMPSPGRYKHALRFRHLDTGKLVPFFDGTITITEGSF